VPRMGAMECTRCQVTPPSTNVRGHGLCRKHGGDTRSVCEHPGRPTCNRGCSAGQAECVVIETVVVVEDQMPGQRHWMCRSADYHKPKVISFNPEVLQPNPSRSVRLHTSLKRGTLDADGFRDQILVKPRPTVGLSIARLFGATERGVVPWKQRERG
jgi:hypothetical protein